jgi:hypothetical protein
MRRSLHDGGGGLLSDDVKPIAVLAQAGAKIHAPYRTASHAGEQD